MDVIVVGAGLSGLQTALKIQEAGLSCCVLEATSRVGGKTLSIPSKKSGPGVNDIGAAWINDTNQSEMYALSQRFGFDLEVQRATGNSLSQSYDGSTATHPFDQPPLSIQDMPALFEMLALTNDLIDKCNLDDPAKSENANELDAITVKNFYEKASSSPIGVAYANQLCCGLLGVDADEVSMLYFINYCKSGRGIEVLISDGKNGAQYLRSRQGMQTFSHRLAAELKPDSLRLSSPVASIEQSTNGLCTVRTTTGDVLQCKRVVVTIPTTLYDSITFSPPLPESKRLLSENTVLGYYSKMIFVFDKPWWRVAGLSGVLSCDTGPISFSRDTSIEADDQWSISCFIVGERGRQWSKLSKAARRKQVWDQFCANFQTVVENIPEPINTLEQEWTKQAYFLGAPCPVMPPGVLTKCGSAIRDPFDRVHFAGTETSVVWMGYMEGALLAGQRCAAEVIEALRS